MCNKGFLFNDEGSAVIPCTNVISISLCISLKSTIDNWVQYGWMCVEVIYVIVKNVSFLYLLLHLFFLPGGAL